MSPRPTGQRYCAGCVAFTTASSRCALCGWDDTRQHESHDHLPRHYLLLGRYYIGRVLGQGGFGVTYLARDLTLNRPVAIKEYLPIDLCGRQANRVTIVPRQGEAQQHYLYGLRRFLDEARSLAQFESHPCIVPVMDFAESNGTAYLVMPYVEGMTLKQHLASRGGRLSYETAIQLIMPVMDALREVHQHGFLHRDVSPDNIFLARLGQVKLLDFGAARHAIGENSKSLSTILKPGYAPEEQYRSHGKQGPWTDVYATGATLYRCVTGKLPPTALDRLADDQLIRPSVFCQQLPTHIEASLLRALAVQGKERFQTIHQFQMSLVEPAAQIAAVKMDGHSGRLSTDAGSVSPRRKNLVIILIVLAVFVAAGLIRLLIFEYNARPVAPDDTEVSTKDRDPDQSRSGNGGTQAGSGPNTAPPQVANQSEGPGPDLAALLKGRYSSGQSSPATPNSSSPSRELLEEERSNTAQSPQAAEFWAGVDQLFVDVEPKWAPNFIQISLQNRCEKTIRVATKIQTPDEGKWLIIGWRIVAAGQSIDTHYITRNSIVYSYAESLDHNSTWDGSEDPAHASEADVAEPFFAHGEDAPPRGTDQRRVSMFPSSFQDWGKHAIIFSCR